MMELINASGTVTTDTEILLHHLQSGSWKYQDLRNGWKQDEFEHKFVQMLQNKSGMTLDIQRKIMTGYDFTQDRRHASKMAMA